MAPIYRVQKSAEALGARRHRVCARLGTAPSRSESAARPRSPAALFEIARLSDPTTETRAEARVDARSDHPFVPAQIIPSAGLLRPSLVPAQIIPRRFIRDASCLGSTDARLVVAMEAKARELVRQRVGPDAFDESELVLGFHWSVPLTTHECPPEQPNTFRAPTTRLRARAASSSSRPPRDLHENPTRTPRDRSTRSPLPRPSRLSRRSGGASSLGGASRLGGPGQLGYTRSSPLANAAAWEGIIARRRPGAPARPLLAPCALPVSGPHRAPDSARGRRRPPWYSVPWLHLHAMYPRRELTRRWKYTPLSFYSIGRVLDRLQRLERQ